MKRRALLASAAAAAAARALPGRAASLRRFGGTLTAGLLGKTPAALGGGDPRTLDPHAARTRLERELAASLHLPLFARAPAHFAGRDAGLLVEQAAPSRDYRTWTVTMRAGLTFADASPLTAADAAASLQRALGAPAGRALAALITDAHVKDDRRLEIVTRVPVRDLAAVLSDLSAAVVSTRAVDPFYGPLGAGGLRPPHAGNGVKPSAITLEASLRSPQGRAWLDRLQVVSGEGSDAAAQYRRGAMLVASGVAKSPERERVTGDAASTIVLVLSPRLSPDLRARAASALDVRTLTQVFLPGARPAASLLPPALFPNGSGAALAHAHVHGAKPATRTTLSLFVADDSADLQPIAERLVFDLLEVGIAATVGWKTPESLEEAIGQNRYDLVLAEWVPLDLDPGRALAGAAKDPVIAATIPAGLDLLAPAGVEERDARATAAQQAAAKLVEGGLFVPLVHPRRALRHGAAVDGLVLDAWGRVDWCDVSLVNGGGP